MSLLILSIVVAQARVCNLVKGALFEEKHSQKKQSVLSTVRQDRFDKTLTDLLLVTHLS
jgi:hypothetical protein